jgi:hypothetical protein
LGGAWADDDEVGCPVGGTLNNLALWASFSLQFLSACEVAGAFFKNVLGRCLFCLPHLFSSCQRRMWSAEKAFTLSLHFTKWTTVEDIE